MLYGWIDRFENTYAPQSPCQGDFYVIPPDKGGWGVRL